MRRALLVSLVRLALRTERGRKLLELAATADEERGFSLLERLAVHYNARVEVRD